ncbi:MAG: hypothetical protein AAB933_01575 [Patescibacteria group bacterium]
MINLIPKEEKRKIARSFFYRLAVVFLFSFSFPVFIGIGIMAPSYVLTRVKTNLVDKKLEAQRSEPVPLIDQETLAVIKDLKNKISLVENAEADKFTVSQKVINAILRKKMPAIKITDIAYESRSPDELAQARKVSIEGTAPSRSALLSFRRALEDDANFQSVDLPISNFIKGSNIQFYLSLVPRPADAAGRVPQ